MMQPLAGRIMEKKKILVKRKKCKGIVLHIHFLKQKKNNKILLSLNLK